MPAQKTPVLKAREAALRALVRVEQDGAYLNLALPPLLQTLPVQEKALSFRLAKGTMQRLNTLDWALNLYSHHRVDTLTPWIRNLLRLGAYQVLYLQRIPDYAVVDQSVKLARRFGHRGVAGLVNAVLRRLTKNSDRLPWPDRSRQTLEYISLRHSHPQWMVSRALARFGTCDTEIWCQANNEQPVVSIRPNCLRTTVDKLAGALALEGYETVESPSVPGVLRVKGPAPPAAAKAFTDGLFTIQGESSVLVAPLLGPSPGDTVVDLCSAPGGKSTHLAELTEDRGRIYAVEVHPGRLRLVKRAARRLDLHSIRPVLADGRKINSGMITTPGAVLVDAPCSGLGVIRRLPEIKWRRKESELVTFQALQLELLASAARLLPSGGKLLYSVCSNEPEETAEVVEKFNHRWPGFELLPLPPLLPPLLQEGQDDPHSVILWPHRHRLDGFFMAGWRKNSNRG